MREILTIGHSTLSYDRFIARLRAAHVTAVADVRTSPFSRNFPQYNREALKEPLCRDEIAYVFLGKELGGRPKGQEFYTDGTADYEKMMAAEAFRVGLDRLEQGAEKYRVAIMCSEGSPLECHRCLLVGRALAGRKFPVGHILSDGRIVHQSDIERRLLAMAGKTEDDMFASPAERLNDAYRKQARKVAFSENRSPPETASAE
jgi:uncharacterized protein (DUF488 family)